MRSKMSVRRVAAATVLPVLALSVTVALPIQAAWADGVPQPNDVVGVGSDTMQYVLDFGADGDIEGDEGFDDADNTYRLFNIDATADANGRAAYGHNVLEPLDPTVVLRAGTFPVQRPDGGDAGISALLADTTPSNPDISYATIVSAPTATTADLQPTVDDATQAETNGWGGLEVFTLGTDTLEMAVATTSNAPAGGLTLAQLQGIYSCNANYRNWDSPYLGGGPDSTITPLLAAPGSDIRDAFLDDLGLSETGGCVETAQSNDPTTIAGDPDAIAPFTVSALNLWQGISGDTLGGLAPNGVPYFHDPSVPYPGSPDPANPGIVLLPGFSLSLDLNVVYRASDQTSTTPWEPGSTLNWAQMLFCDPGGPTPFFQTGAGQVLIAEAGANPSSQSCTLDAP
jgi:hypothetical protein